MVEASVKRSDNEALVPPSVLIVAFVIDALFKVERPETATFVMVVVAKAVVPANVTAPEIYSVVPVALVNVSVGSVLAVADKLVANKLVVVALLARRFVTFATAAERFVVEALTSVPLFVKKFVEVTFVTVLLVATKFVTITFVEVALPSVALVRFATVAAKLVDVAEVNVPPTAVRLVA